MELEDILNHYEERIKAIEEDAEGSQNNFSHIARNLLSGPYMAAQLREYKPNTWGQKEDENLEALDLYLSLVKENDSLRKGEIGSSENFYFGEVNSETVGEYISDIMSDVTSVDEENNSYLS